MMSKDPTPVERQLNKVCNKLNITEVNIGLFNRMIRSNIATNDVRNFVNKQQKLKKSSKVGSGRVLTKVAMKQKLRDAYSTANGLRREKKRLKETLHVEGGYSKSRTKRTVRKVMKRANIIRHQQKIKVKKKFLHCKSKYLWEEQTAEFDLLPSDVKEYVREINVFKEEVIPEHPADPMVCSKEIKLSRCEMALLRKGPKFMMRGDLDEQEFKVDLQKMIIKEKFDKVGQEKMMMSLLH